ncbi:MAG: dihydropteroate synthase [Acidobacteria bacterium]|jgi:5-methyltetrahydrofolate--homocysteine methyltransferase|nr:dihydropteroate synthase [Acidobacteriota bacterium]
MTTIVGNKLNSANKKVLDRMNKKDYEFIRREAQMQIEAGAEYIELNALSLLHNETPFLREIIPMLEKLGARLVIVSENVEALKQALLISKNPMIVGAVEYDIEKIDFLIDTVMEKNAKLIALIKDKRTNHSHSPEKSLLIAQKYIDYLLDRGMKRQDILLDPLLRPLEEDFNSGRVFLDTLELFKLDFPQVKTMANVSMLAEGLPKRQMIASYFVSLAIAKGLDYIVTNVLDENFVESIVTTLSIIGKDKNLQSYLKYCRSHKEAKEKGMKDGGAKNKRDLD